MEMDQYLEVFIEESKEHLQACNEHLLELEKEPENISIVNEIFRSAHTLKGMSATMGYDDLASLTHQMENVLDGIRNMKITVTPSLLDIVFKAVDYLEEMIFSIADGGDGKKDVSDVVFLLKKIESGEEVKDNETPVTVNPKTEDAAVKSNYDDFELTVIQQSKEQGFNCYEISIVLREDCLLKAARVFMVFEVLEQVGEIIKSIPSVDQLEEEQFQSEFTVTLVSTELAENIEKRIMKVSEIDRVTVLDVQLDSLKAVAQEQIQAQAEVAPTLADRDEQPKSEKEDQHPAKSSNKHGGNHKTIRVNIERLDILMNLFEELVIDRGRLEQISRDLNHSELNETVERMSRISGDLQNIILTMRMVPVETVFNRFPRMVRQLAKDLHKKIDLQIIGAETELDRTVIDEIGDPLVHLLRNALDHGIETPEIRLQKGKQEEGTVILRAYHSGNHVFIEIEDDGAGISRDKILQKAINKGLITAKSAETLTDSQVFDFIFSSGFSTAEKISDVSGRGVGLDVVKNTIESLGGSITIRSAMGKGSVFSIQLPLTLSIISVMLVEVQNEKYAIPLSSIIETAIIKRSEILHAHNQKVIDFRGKVVPLVNLKDIFEVPATTDEDEYLSVVIVKKADKSAGLIVDSFIGQQEIVLKSLGNYLSSVFAISGGTILGDGQVALIVDCNALIK
ncbi:chemotaxis protein CheA [Fredinandcohnia sp. QZ13]|uniref:chemotaxis protein CheA n=1 Tax=Fredinandcohnia sp. QZ13 TaxID=3073144 RepID=UPI002853555A|nr:chemotaxis protein CheA [Fredinandcohnia sp. QZ13]MDR4886478.1 chemotaxis protein CheA [Fredinandcohnia sp. QZ13]